MQVPQKLCEERNLPKGSRDCEFTTGNQRECRDALENHQLQSVWRDIIHLREANILPRLTDFQRGKLCCAKNGPFKRQIRLNRCSNQSPTLSRSDVLFVFRAFAPAFRRGTGPQPVQDLSPTVPGAACRQLSSDSRVSVFPLCRIRCRHTLHRYIDGTVAAASAPPHSCCRLSC